MENPIVEKIKKLFAMANRASNNDGSSNEQEASAAMAKAQELLAKYNLDMKTIQDSAKRTANGEVETAKRDKQQINRSAMYTWQRTFWAGLAEANYCFHWITPARAKTNKGADRWVKRHVILGSEANVAAVTVMGEYLTETMERLLPYTNKERLSRSAISWREGCAVRLIERIQEKMEAMKRSGFKAADGTQVTALAVVDVHEKEYAANYDAAYGAGAYARSKQRSAEWTAQAAQRTRDAEEEKARLLGSETPEQREQREARELKAAAKQRAKDAAWTERYYRREARKAARRDLAAYARGCKKADSVNLDAQIKDGNRD
jgi:hypothetical protein